MSFCQFGEILCKEKRSLQRFEVVKVGSSCLCGSKLPLDLKNGLAWNLVCYVMFTIIAGIEVLDFQVKVFFVWIGIWEQFYCGDRFFEKFLRLLHAHQSALIYCPRFAYCRILNG